jgi:hypothetical protein
MWVRLIRKLADFLDGVDVSEFREGDVFELPAGEAHLLIAERWAEPHIPALAARQLGRELTSEAAVFGEARQLLERLRRVREQIERQSFAAHERRRVEDRIRDELRDSRTITVRAGRRVG